MEFHRTKKMIKKQKIKNIENNYFHKVSFHEL